MTVKIPAYKNHFFLLSFVLAFMLFLISPISAYSAPYTKFTDIPFLGYVYNGDTFSVNDLSAQTSLCEGQGAGWAVYSSSVSDQKIWTNDGGSWPVQIGSVGAYSTKTWVFNYGAYTGRKFALATECYAPGSVFELVPMTGGYYLIGSGSRPGPDISLSATPTSGTPPFNSNITVNKGNFDTLIWNITAPNETVYNLGSVTYNNFNIDAEGSWVVRATLINDGGSDYASLTITGNTVEAPIASFSCSPTNSTSPALITCSDSSIHQSTSWLWSLESLGLDMQPSGTMSGGVYYLSNTSQNIQFTASGSGVINVFMRASNSFGYDDEYKPSYITVAGVAPTPTPTPNIPWPNQTGVCWRSGITLGSGQVRDYIVHYQLTNPQGDTYSGQYQAGVQNYITNQPFFTALEGQYVYQELALVTGELLWRQSYIVEDCTVTPTVTQTIITGVPTPSVTYTIPATYSTITIPTGRYTAPVTPVPYDTASPPPTIPVYPTLDFGAGSEDLYNYTITVSPLSKPVVDFLKRWLDSTLKTAIGYMLAIVISPFMYVLSAIPQSLTAFTSGMLTFAQFPILFFYATGTIVRNMPEKVMIAFSIFLWWNIIRYLWGYVRRGGS